MFCGHRLFAILFWFRRSHLGWLLAPQPTITVQLPLCPVCPEQPRVLEVPKYATWTPIPHISASDFWLLFLNVCAGNYTEYPCTTPVTLPCHYNEHITHRSRVSQWFCQLFWYSVRSVELQLPEAGDYRGISESSLLPWKAQNKAWICALWRLKS